MKMRGGALPWVLLFLTVFALVFMYILVDPPGEKPAREHAFDTEIQSVGDPLIG